MNTLRKTLFDFLVGSILGTLIFFMVGYNQTKFVPVQYRINHGRKIPMIEGLKGKPYPSYKEFRIVSSRTIRKHNKLIAA